MIKGAGKDKRFGPLRGARPRELEMKKRAITILFMGILSSLSAQPLDLSEERGKEAFRTGVEAYQKAYYNKAITSFENALRYSPGEVRYRYWLGNALYYSGFVEAAMGEWDNVLRSGVPYPYLESFLRIIRTRRGVLEEIQPLDRKLSLYSLDGTITDEDLQPRFQRPTAVRPLPDGGYILAAFGTEDVLQYNANGLQVMNYFGSPWGFDGPYDILPYEDGFFVSEFTTDQVAWVNSMGIKTRSFGGKGREEGLFMGPGYMTMDEEDYLYVVDYGNARVQKFTLEGDFLLSFGAPVSGFEGMREPTGIVYAGGRIWVADRGKQRLFSFDTSGNFLEEAGSGMLETPEGLSADGEQILVADGREVRAYLPRQRTWTTILGARESQGTILFAARDANQNLLAAHFDHDKIENYTSSSRLISGLNVEILRVYSKDFPRVYVDLEVEDWLGNPLVGLQRSNFLIEESQTRVAELQMDFTAFSDQEITASVIIQTGGNFRREEVMETFETFRRHLPNMSKWNLFASDPSPTPLSLPEDTFLERVKKTADTLAMPKAGGLDQSIRLAAGEIIGILDRPVLFYLTDGTADPQDFVSYDVVKIGQFLKNNRITFVPIQMGAGGMASELRYLAEETGGEVVMLRDSRSFTQAFENIRSKRLGRYILEYNAITPSEFGLRYIPVTIEVNYFKQSGRGSLGYFAPLDLSASNP
jgi:hypothetical protein